MATFGCGYAALRTKVEPYIGISRGGEGASRNPAGTLWKIDFFSFSVIISACHRQRRNAHARGQLRTNSFPSTQPVPGNCARPRFQTKTPGPSLLAGPGRRAGARLSTLRPRLVWTNSGTLRREVKSQKLSAPHENDNRRSQRRVNHPYF
jgi:hypothetical protein